MLLPATKAKVARRRRDSGDIDMRERFLRGAMRAYAREKSPCYDKVRALCKMRHDMRAMKARELRCERCALDIFMRRYALRDVYI